VTPGKSPTAIGENCKVVVEDQKKSPVLVQRESNNQLSKSLLDRYRQVAPKNSLSPSDGGKIQIIGTNEVVKSTPNVIVSKVYEYASSDQSSPKNQKEKKRVFTRNAAASPQVTLDGLASQMVDVASENLKNINSTT